MLVLSRRTGEQIQIGDDVSITVLAIQGRRVRIGIDAPGGYHILRGELADWVHTTDEKRPEERLAEGA